MVLVLERLDEPTYRERLLTTGDEFVVSPRVDALGSEPYPRRTD